MTTFNIYRRESNDINPPVAIATGVDIKSYSDSTATHGDVYLYSIGAVISGTEKMSSEIKIQAGDLDWNNVVSLLYFKDNFTDETGRIWANNGVSFSEETPFLGIKSCSFSTSLLSELRSSESTNLGSGDFTIELWSKGVGSLFSKRIPTGTSNGGMTFFVNQSSRLAAWNGSQEVSSSGVIDVNAFTHKAFVKHGDRLKIFNNGVMVYDDIYSISDNTYPMQIGAAIFNGVAVDFFNGLIAMPRITKTARYTENFTPSDFVFPNS